MPGGAAAGRAAEGRCGSSPSRRPHRPRRASDQTPARSAPQDSSRVLPPAPQPGEDSRTSAGHPPPRIGRPASCRRPATRPHVQIETSLAAPRAADYVRFSRFFHAFEVIAAKYVIRMDPSLVQLHRIWVDSNRHFEFAGPDQAAGTGSRFGASGAGRGGPAGRRAGPTRPGAAAGGRRRDGHRSRSSGPRWRCRPRRRRPGLGGRPRSAARPRCASRSSGSGT